MKEAGALVQILLPLVNGSGDAGMGGFYDELREELTERFGGVTAYLRSPATGLWKNEEDRVERDSVVIYEVMVEEVDRDWWAALRERIRIRLQQDELIIRAIPFQRL
jgi:hypothetical protein